MILKDYVVQKLTFLQMPKKQNKKQENLPPEVLPTVSKDEEPISEPVPATTLLPNPVPAPEETASFSAQVDFEAGMLACKEKNYSEALETLLRAAKTGHREAQFVCGQFYQRGLTAEADCKRAITWYKRAAKQGLLQAQISCAVMYEEGTGTAINMKRALYWYEQAAKQGDVDAQLKCGRMYYYGRAETRNPQKARRWLEAAAEHGCEDACRLLQEFF